VQCGPVSGRDGGGRHGRRCWRTGSGDAGSAHPGRRGAGRRGIRRGLVEVTVGEVTQGGEYLRRLGAGGPDQDLVTLLDAKDGHAVQAPRADRARRNGDVLGRHRGVEPACGLHEPRRWTSVQAEAVGHGDAQLERASAVRPGCWFLLRRARLGAGDG
jgi:hypothetical protein